MVRTTHLTTVSGIEFAIRTAMRRERYWHSTGATEEDDYKDWVAIKNDLVSAEDHSLAARAWLTVFTDGVSP